MSKFREWVDQQGGPSRLSWALQITPTAVSSWMRRLNCPNPHVILELVKRGNGAFSAEDIIRECLPAAKKFKKKRKFKNS